MQSLHVAGWIHSFSLLLLHPKTTNLHTQQSRIEFPSCNLLPQLTLYIWDRGRALMSTCQTQFVLDLSALFLLSGYLLPAFVNKNFISPYVNLRFIFLQPGSFPRNNASLMFFP